MLSRETGVPLRRLYAWKHSWERDPEWRPWDFSTHGLQHRIFTQLEEQALAEYIADNCLSTGLLFTNDAFRQLAIQAFLEKHPDDNVPDFACSDDFIADFKRRNGFSSRRAHLKRRPAITDSDRLEWIQTVATLLMEVNDHNRIVNVDESSWRVYPTCLRTWANRGAENVSLHISWKEKDAFTVVAAITAARTKLPLSLIAVGKTSVVEESHFGDVAYHRTDHSESGWTTYDTFERWLSWLRSVYDDGEPIWVILDCYSVHRQEATKEYAASIGVNLLFIPPGMTDELQPLDRYVFGVMKANCRRSYRPFCQANPDAPMDQRTAAAFLIRAWEYVSTQVLDEAWSIYDASVEADN
jgi:hypothetical protein